ncbi:hypothetical protein GRI75_07565 [Altererythrobacter soli]|uniref:DUF4148 domain-containing protein n=1 Tax=Croceibacterium soli TaxID=1739690 RepID=A0A6I4UR86_9SPHN|nr:hypothetical protein [Croceibacterium soli]MXP41500.1 hypothetical protein [Croceibacterium soli]
MKITALLAAASIAFSGGALAQSRTADSAAGTPTDGDVAASTYGSGTSTPDSVAVSGGGQATAENGGTATSESRARFNNNNAHQRSVAAARDDDERARSTTMTRVRKDGEVSSRSMSIYKQRGEKPVIERDSSRSGN